MRIATCALDPITYHAEWLRSAPVGDVDVPEAALLAAWLQECAAAHALIYYDDRAADFAHALRRVVEQHLPVPFRAGRRGCCRGVDNRVELIDLDRELGERQYELVPTIFRAVEPLLCFPEVWRHCWQRGNLATQQYFAAAHAAATACLYLHTLLATGVATTAVDAAVARVLALLEAHGNAAPLTLDISDLSR